jgi:hypothetical protein
MLVTTGKILKRYLWDDNGFRYNQPALRNLLYK